MLKQACVNPPRDTPAQVYPACCRTRSHSNPLHALQDALTAGYKFYLSANGVLLCEGPLPVNFVQQVTEQELQQLWSAEHNAP